MVSIENVLIRCWLPIALVLPLMLGGCAGARVQSVVDPAYGRAETRYDGFLAYALFKDLALEAEFERALCERLLAAGHACIPMIEAAPPTRAQNGAIRHRASINSGAQASLLIELADPDNAVRQTLAPGQAAFEVSVVDNASQQVAAHLTIALDHCGKPPAELAQTVADAVVAELKTRKLLYTRGEKPAS